MLSKLAFRSVQNGRPCMALIIRGSSSVTKPAEDQVEVKFEKLKRPIYPGKVRLGFVPEEWFQFFYPKTGVTGPYVFGYFLSAFLLSKEYFIMEHEAYTGIALGLWVYALVKNLGPKLGDFLDKEIESEISNLKDYRDGNINGINDSIEEEKTSQLQAQAQTTIFDAKRENIGLQLEAVYRERLAAIHSQVKNKLDYQLETANVRTKLEQRHMVSWIVNSVRKSITPAQESAALKQCLGDLKAMAAKA